MAVRVEVARLVARGVLPALAFMHDGMGMAHRDVKPNNILYRGDMATGTLRFYLSDFGLARFVRYPSDEAEEPARARRAVRSHAPTRAHGGGDDDDDDDGEGKEDGARDTVGGREGRDPAGGAPQAEDPSDAEGDDAEADAGAARPEDRRPGPFTANVITHMYKPPEVLLAYRHRHSVEHGIRYTTAVDMWSLGIVLLEVLAGGHLTPTHPESTLDERMRAVLCVGSPADAGPNGGARTARMATLTQGAPSDEQIAAHAAHVRGMIKKIVARGLMGRSGMGSTASVLLMTEGAMEPYTDVIDLIERLVCIDPRRRIAARDALLHPFVAGTTDDATAADAGTSVTVPTAPASDSRGSNDDVVDRPSAPGETGDGTTGRRPKGRARPRGTRHDVQPESDIYDHDGQGRNEGKEGRGSTPALLRPWFLGACAYRALSAESPRAKERPRADCGDVSPTVAARRLAVTRMCQFADRHRFHPRTIAGAVLMLDHYLDAVATPRASDAAQKGCQGGGEGGRGCDDPNLLVAGAGALFIMSSLYETRWPSLEDYATMGRVPASWYADRKPPTASIRYPTSDAVLRASVDVFEAVNHLVPSQRAVASVLGSARIAAARCEADFWRTLTSALARYPPGVRRS
jgi:serine/threonine protein kinase